MENANEDKERKKGWRIREYHRSYTDKSERVRVRSENLDRGGGEGGSEG